MPVIAIGAALVADVVAGAAVAGTVGGIAAISATTAFEIVAAVGATVGAIGAVTRDKTLSTVGMVVGAIGGIGGLASSAGLFGAEAASGAPLFGTTPAAETGATFADSLTPATQGAAAGGGVETGTWDAAMTADQAASGTIDSVANGLPTDLQSFSTTSENVSDPAKVLAGPRVDQVAATDTTTGILNGGVGTTASSGTSDLIPPPPAPPNGLGTADPVTGQNIESAVDPVTGKIVTMPDSGSSGIFGSILDFAKKNPVVALGTLQAAGSFLSGATSTLTPAQVNALNAQAAANQAAANMATQQQKNLALPKAVASSAPVTGAPGPLIGSTPGLLNSAPRVPVTGVPA